MKRLLIAIALLITAGQAGATVFYVDCAADGDAGAGTSTAANVAWKTVAKVNSSSFSAGDNVLFKKGCTWREQLTVPSSGSAGNPITFGAYGSGAAPIIDGSDIATTWVADAGDEESGGVFASGFETEVDAMTSAFTSKTEANSNTIAVTTAANTFNNGAKGAVLTYAGTAGLGTYITKDIGTNSKYVRAYFKLATGFTADAAARVLQILESLDGGWGAGSYIAIESDTGQTGFFHLKFGYRYPGAGNTVVGTTADNTIKTNTWYSVEIHYEKSASATIDYYLDNVSVGATGALNSNSYNMAQIRIGSALAYDETIMVPTNNSKIYFDDVKASTSYVGLYSGSAIANVYNTTVAATPTQVFRDGSRITKGSSKAGLNDHEWFANGTTLSMRDDSGDPDGLGYVINASVRDYNVIETTKNNLVFQNLTLTMANQRSVYFAGYADNVTIDNSTMTKPYLTAIRSNSAWEAQNITISNNTISYTGGHAIDIRPAAHNWTIDNNVIRNYSQLDYQNPDELRWSGGVHMWCEDNTITNILIQNNEIYNGARLDNGSYLPDTGTRGPAIWFDSVKGNSGNIIRYNHIHHNNYLGIHLEFSDYIKAYYNVIHDINAGDGINVGAYSNVSSFGVHNNEIYNNTIWNAAFTCILSQGRSDHAAGASTGNLFKNNIGYNCGRGLKAINGGENDGTMGSGNVYEYNHFGTDGNNIVEWGSGVVKTTYAAWETAYGGTTHSVQTDPLFVSTVTPDFSLQAGSPAIDNGANVGLTIDYLGNGLSGAAYDIGAHEYQAGGSDTTPSAYSFTDNTGVALSTVIYSNLITVAGIDAASAISISGSGCEYRINSGSWVSSSGSVVLNDTVGLRGTSSASFSTALPSCTLTIGGVNDTGAPWTATTRAVATFYVDQTAGSDTAAGTSTGAPWKTIAKVNASTFIAGDNVLFKRGETWAETLTVPSSGSAGSPVMFGAYGSGDKPIINGSGGSTGIDIYDGRTYITIDSIDVIGGSYFAVIVRPGSNNATIKNSILRDSDGTATDVGQGISVDGASNVLIDNCIIKDNSDDGIWIGDAQSVLTTDNVTVSNNTLTGNGWGVEGNGGQGDRDGIGVYDSTNVVINNNHVDHTAGSNAVFYGTSDNSARQSVTLSRNTFIKNTAGAMANPRIVSLGDGTYTLNYNIISGYSTVSPITYGVNAEGNDNSQLNITLYNNVIAGVDRSIGIYMNAGENASNTYVYKNNISINPTTGYHLLLISSTVAKLTSDYNVYYPDSDNTIYAPPAGGYSLSGWRALSGNDIHSLSADPLFVSSSDFTLQASSPARNTGADVGLTTDYLGNGLYGAAWDIGAYEMQSGATGGTPSAPRGLSTFQSFQSFPGR